MFQHIITQTTYRWIKINHIDYRICLQKCIKISSTRGDQAEIACSMDSLREDNREYLYK